MKKYIQPSIEVIDMEISPVMTGSTGSVEVSQENTDQMELGRRRGDAWSAYDGIE
jgi:hypothetical protein